jgi:hypothetical protein
LPLCTVGQIDGSVSKMMSTWPPSSAVIAGALPVNGTCTMSVLVVSLNNSAARWSEPP